MFDGNTDQDTIVYHELNPPIRARYIRFQPKAWNKHISMRVELYNCKGIKGFLLQDIVYSVVFVFLQYQNLCLQRDELKRKKLECIYKKSSVLTYSNQTRRISGQI